MSTQFGPNRFGEDITNYEDKNGVPFEDKCPHYASGECLPEPNCDCGDYGTARCPVKPDPQIQKIINEVYKADCIRISPETAARLLGNNPGRSAKSIASQFVCEQLSRDFGGDLDSGDFDDRNDPYGGLSASMYDLSECHPDY